MEIRRGRDRQLTWLCPGYPAPLNHGNSVCPTVRSLPVSDSALNVFEQRVRGANLTEHQVFFFPKYGECPQPSHTPSTVSVSSPVTLPSM